MSRPLRISPPILLVFTYIAWILAGTLLLRMPIASDGSVGWSDALFTATSAVTVTGLAVFDVGATLSLFGEAVLMVLIQFGGMGLMTFAVLILSSLGLKIGLVQRSFLREEMGLDTLSGLLRLAWVLFRVVLVCEIVGMIFLATVFVPEFGWGAGLWQSAFHSVSAFNNAGFSLFATSLMDYSDNPVVLITISLQFVVGGIGFIVLSEVFSREGWRRFSLHTKLTIVGTVALIVLGISGYALLEWNNPRTLGGIDTVSGKLLASWFEGLTPRTAGFNALDTAAVSDSTALLTIVLMIIGGGSTSTAGGLKVTTAVVLFLATIAFFRNAGRIHCFGYSIGLDVTVKVMALLTVSVIVLLTGTFLIISTHDLDFLDAVFEVSSAFGTVGLSRGITGELDDLGRAILCTIMFLGRLGPLTLGILLATAKVQRVKYPQGSVHIG